MFGKRRLNKSRTVFRKLLTWFFIYLRSKIYFNKKKMNLIKLVENLANKLEYKILT